MNVPQDDSIAVSELSDDADSVQRTTPRTPALPVPSRWTAVAALVIALIGVALALWALVRSPAETGYSAEGFTNITTQQSDEAKANVCAAFDTVRQAVELQTNVDSGPEPAARQSVAANARLATLGGGSYLLNHVDIGTPPELARAVQSFGDSLQEIGMKQLTGAPSDDPALTEQLNVAQEATTRIIGLCE